METEELKINEKYNTIQSAVYTVAEIQEILKISRRSAYELVKQNLFPVIKIKTSIRIPKKGFNEWLNKTV